MSERNKKHPLFISGTRDGAIGLNTPRGITLYCKEETTIASIAVIPYEDALIATDVAVGGFICQENENSIYFIEWDGHAKRLTQFRLPLMPRIVNRKVLFVKEMDLQRNVLSVIP